jgi:hypothetical protein
VDRLLGPAISRSKIFKHILIKTISDSPLGGQTARRQNSDETPTPQILWQGLLAFEHDFSRAVVAKMNSALQIAENLNCGSVLKGRGSLAAP